MNKQAQHRRQRQEPATQHEDGDREHQGTRCVEHEQLAEHAAHAVEHEVEMDGAHDEQTERAEESPGHHRAVADAGAMVCSGRERLR
ncbi:hypothetical protein [Nostocoides sp. HKS02]|uniref:hypothetical protein n=1 Tax=Nostocoides sp. HKS02 TaxID=1813880 RepID=UPI001E4B7B5A|nr:hypothetical protein [Tetrasphaera sp. HKS02]